MWNTYNIEDDLLSQQEGYGLAINNEGIRIITRNSFINKNSETISRGYQIGNQIVFETEPGRGNCAIIKI